MNRSKKIPSSPEQLYNYIRNNFSSQRVLCAYEAGPTGYDLYDYLTQKEQPCVVVPPASIPKASNERVKTNRLDSERIVRYIKTGELRPVRVPSEPYRELRELVSVRDNYARQGAVAKQRIRSLVLFEHLYDDIRDADARWSGAFIRRLKQVPCSSAVRYKLDRLLEDLEYARKHISDVLKELKMFCDTYPDIDRYRRYLQSIPGIGLVTSLTVLARIGDPERLASIREIAGFAGIVPRETSTGDTIRRGSITHAGNAALRSLLIEASWVAIKYDKELEQFYHRIRSRHHPSFASRKAIVAVARKLTQRIYTVLKEQRTYEVR
ncbi:MAG: IS110 family transposase [Candidatus Dadabacteria bacterium]|nr:IS110 family transposase [Candidatus Dadabacteria bacterium]